MTLHYRSAAAEDWEAIARLLNACALPVAGARAHLRSFTVAGDDGALAGCAGAEVYGGDALLRSLAVRAESRGAGIGEALVARVLHDLRVRGVRRVSLLTTTAEAFFAPRGFVPVAREAVPAGVRASEEFQGACPASAVAMMRSL